MATNILHKNKQLNFFFYYYVSLQLLLIINEKYGFLYQVIKFFKSQTWTIQNISIKYILGNYMLLR